jgi:hypothetical protein
MSSSSDPADGCRGAATSGVPRKVEIAAIAASNLLRPNAGDGGWVTSTSVR